MDFLNSVLSQLRPSQIASSRRALAIGGAERAKGCYLRSVCVFFVFRISCFVFRISYFVFHVSYFVFRISYIVIRISYFVFRISYFVFPDS